MWKKYRLYAIPLVIGLVIAAMLVGGCSSQTTSTTTSAPPATTTTTSAAETYKLTFALFQPEVAAVSKANTEYAKAIQDRTNGRVEITVYQGGSLLGAPAMYQGIIDDIADMGNGISSYDIEVPSPGESGWSASGAAYDFINKYQPKEWNEVKVLTAVMSAGGLTVIGMAKDQVKTLEDMKGKSFRVNSPEFVTALGATIKDLPMADVYDSLSKGVIDGVDTSLEPMKSWKLADVTKYVTLYMYPQQPNVMWYNAMNLGKWNSLPPDLQKIIMDTSAEYSRKIGLVWDDQLVAGLEYTISVGDTIYVLPPDEEAKFTAALAPVTQEQFDKAASKGGYTRQQVDEVFAYFTQQEQYWNGQQAANGVQPVFDRVWKVLEDHGIAQKP
jgi:TRAP-type C4-dicarboxylate transport system substrate-binding protein